MRALIIASSLESAINDALSFNDVLNDRGYSTILLLENRAKYHTIIKSLSWLAKSKRCILYFAGHSKKGDLLCQNDILKIKDIEEYLILKSKGQVIMILDCCGDLRLGDYSNVILINNISHLAYDRVIDNKRRGLLTYYLLATLRRYNYAIDTKDLEIEVNGKLLQYNQVIKIKSSVEKIHI